MKKINQNLYYLGVNDHEIDLFEGQYKVENGMAYNSYLLEDEKVAIMDTVDVRFSDLWLENIVNILKNVSPTYLIIQHMEPDHSGSIINFLKKYPNTILVGNFLTFKLLDQFYRNLNYQKMIVKDGDSLSLGNSTLKFVTAPMVHWPEVMMTYDITNKVMFSADAFGKFGALDVDEEWDCEARRYYFGIVGKYGDQVQQLLSKIKNFEIKCICSLHGPILDKDLSHYLSLYNTWSNYDSEVKGVGIFFTSVYGHTKQAALLLKDKLDSHNCKTSLMDLARDDMAECVEDAFKYSCIVLATTTYNTSIFPFMNEFINELVERNYKNKTIAIIENGSWAPQVERIIKDRFKDCENITFINPVVSITSSLSNDNMKEIDILSDELIKNL